MHKCIRNINIYVIYSPTDTLRSNGILSFRTFSISYNSDRNLYYNLYRVATFKAYIQGVRLKSDVMHKLFESNGGGHCYEERRNSFLFRGERTTFVERNEIFYHHREMGLATRDAGEGGEGENGNAYRIIRTISSAAPAFWILNRDSRITGDAR